MTSPAPRKKVTIHTDGGCHGNPGPGGWAAVLKCGPHRREIGGGEPATTNNRMELTAALEALRALKTPCDVELHTDSQYLKNGVTRWIRTWKRNGWRTAAKKPVKNADLWKALEAEVDGHTVRWHWVKGHAGNEGNERCDTRANQEIDRIRRNHTAEELRDFLEAFKKREDGEEDARLL
ncbi:MAG: ribonuclease HI [Verrucomicrobiae bacterium]|nr:ribonuclease HI [Verrucomicrobiae bacterium]